MVPAGTGQSCAKGKKVTASDSDPVVGTLDLVTDGDKEGDEGSWVELGPGKQWVQIDLAKRRKHLCRACLAFPFAGARLSRCRGAGVRRSKLRAGVTTIFNNDFTDELGLGAGRDLNYIETYQGKLIDAKGVKGRYVRLYSNGNTTNKLNHYIEVEVWGKPA